MAELTRRDNDKNQRGHTSNMIKWLPRNKLSNICNEAYSLHCCFFVSCTCKCSSEEDSDSENPKSSALIGVTVGASSCATMIGEPTAESEISSSLCERVCITGDP